MSDLDVVAWNRHHRRSYDSWPVSTEPLIPLWSYVPTKSQLRMSWAITLADDVIGRITLAHIDRRDPTLSIHMSPLFVGRGFGSRGLSKFLDMLSYSFSVFNLYVSPSNTRALAVYHKSGFKPISLLRWPIPLHLLHLGMQYAPDAVGFDVFLQPCMDIIHMRYISSRFSLSDSLLSRSGCQAGETVAAAIDRLDQSSRDSSTLDSNGLSGL